MQRNLYSRFERVRKVLEKEFKGDPQVYILREHDEEPENSRKNDIVIRIVPAKGRVKN